MKHHNKCSYDYDLLEVKKLEVDRLESCKHNSYRSCVEKMDADKLKLNRELEVIKVGKCNKVKTLQKAIELLQDRVIVNTEIRLEKGTYEAVTIDGFTPLNPLKIVGDTREIASSNYIQGKTIFFMTTVNIVVVNIGNTSEIEIFLATDQDPVNVEQDGLLPGDKVEFFDSDINNFINTTVTSVNGIKFIVDTIIPSVVKDGSTITFLPNVIIEVDITDFDKTLLVKQSSEITGILVKPITTDFGFPSISFMVNDEEPTLLLKNTVLDLSESEKGLTFNSEGGKLLLFDNVVSSGGSGIAVNTVCMLSGTTVIRPENTILFQKATSLTTFAVINPEKDAINIDIQSQAFLEVFPERLLFILGAHGANIHILGLDIWNSSGTGLVVNNGSKVYLAGTFMKNVKTGVKINNATNAYFRFNIINECETGIESDTSFIAATDKITVSDFSEAAFKSINGSSIILKATPDLTPLPGSTDYCIDQVSRIILNGNPVGTIGC